MHIILRLMLLDMDLVDLVSGSVLNCTIMILCALSRLLVDVFIMVDDILRLGLLYMDRVGSAWSWSFNTLDLW